MSETLRPFYKRHAFAKDTGDGESCAEWTLTPNSVTDPVQIIAEPITSLPIIFVPGIMGSNLKLTVAVDGKKKDDPVWLMNGQVAAGWAWIGVDAASRQLRLNPSTTAVFDGGDIASEIPSIGNSDAIRKNRFWGEVSAMSYGAFLVWLQRTMNHAGRTEKWRGELGHPDFADHIAKGLAFKPLTEADVLHAASFRFPVYACGYNWLQSNRVAADVLAARISKVIAANNSESYQCEQVIIVTHSMGGLVARACSELAGMRDKIAGIVHGVMPATGAAVAYKRVRCGTEGLAGRVIGDTAEKVTAVFANSPGALELLPNRQYGNGWLELGVGSGASFRAAVTLPKSDPYEEVYKQRGAWWALVREGLINPASLKDHRGWEQYLANIDTAAGFHKHLGNQYHPATYTFHGDGIEHDNGVTWGKVRWFASARVIDAASALKLKPLDDDGKGNVSAGNDTGLRCQFAIASKNSAGDGTVPITSGNAPVAAGAQATYHLNLDAEGHEGAYRVDMARRVTLHAILAIAQRARVCE